MRQGVLPYEFARASKSWESTAHAGLCPYLELACAAGLVQSIRKHVDVCSDTQGWTDVQIILALVCLNLAGGDCVNDLRILEADDGFGRVFRMAEVYGLSLAERRRFEKRWRKGRERHTPSPSVVFRFLSAFHDHTQEEVRAKGQAFIPAPSPPLRSLVQVNADLVGFMQSRCPETAATLDMDATLVETFKRDALYSYKGYKAFQPMNVYWAEKGAVVFSEFRDGNVNAGYEQLRVLEEALSYLPAGVKKVRVRSDTAGYQHNLLRWCALGKSERFGVIDFAIGCPVTSEFEKAVSQVKEKDWQPLYADVDGHSVATGREWAEVPLYVPIATARSKSDPDYTYLATREALRQQPISGLQEQLELPFQTMSMPCNGRPVLYKVFGTVTNLAWRGDRVLRWLNLRCGKGEEVHSIQKGDLAGGQLPSGDFGENAAWWSVMVLAFNLNVIMKRLVMKGNWTNRRMKELRFHLINVSGTLLNHAGQFVMKLNTAADVLNKLIDIRRAIRAMCAPALN